MEIDIRGYCYCILIFLSEHFFGSVLTGELKHPAFLVAQRAGVGALIWQSLSCWVLKFSLTWGLVTALTQLLVYKPKARAINKENELFQLESCHFSLSSHAVGSCSIWFWLKCSLRFDVCVEPYSVSGTLFKLLSTQTAMFRLSNQFFFFNVQIPRFERVINKML